MDYRKPFTRCHTEAGVYRALTRVNDRARSNGDADAVYWLTVAANQRVDALRDAALYVSHIRRA